jgi:putative transposase
VAEDRDIRPWQNIEEIEFATLEWVDWFNNRRLFEPIGNLSPVEFEALYHERQEAPAMVAGLT